jgi:phosphoribosylformylglycinamidine synthase
MTPETVRRPRFLILWGDGINCENESARAVAAAGGEAETLHVAELLRAPARLGDYDALILPGGFSFGDHLGSGQVLALQLAHRLRPELEAFARAKPVLGICNGFQTLIRLGLLPDADFQRKCALVGNAGGHFIDRWIELKTDFDSPCIWTRGLPERFFLPMRHGEGRLIAQEDGLIDRLVERGQAPLTYCEDVNGSARRIAGVCDASGLVFGLMPHPEAALYDWQCPFDAPSLGLQFFKNAVQYLSTALPA